MMASPNSADAVLGAWRLVSVRVQMEDTGETLDLLGADPKGFIIFGSDGRMMTVLSASGRMPPANETETAATFRGMMAYTGRFSVEQNRIVTEVDVAWHPAWENTQRVRFVDLEGDRLTLTTEVQDQGHPSYPDRRLRGVVVWARES